MGFSVPHEPQLYPKLAIKVILEMSVLCVGDSLAGHFSLNNFLNTLNAAVLSDAGQGRKQLEATTLLKWPGSPVTPLKPGLAHSLNLRTASSEIEVALCCKQAGWRCPAAQLSGYSKCSSAVRRLAGVEAD